MADESNDKSSARKKKSAVNAPTIELKATEVSVSGPTDPEPSQTAAPSNAAVADAVEEASVDAPPGQVEAPVAEAPADPVLSSAAGPSSPAEPAAVPPDTGTRKPRDAEREAPISAAAPKLDVFDEPQPSFFQRPLAAGLIGGVAGAALMAIATTALRPAPPPLDPATAQAMAAMQQELQSNKDALDRAVGRLTVAENNLKNTTDLANAANGAAAEAKTVSDAARKDVAAVAASAPAASNGAPVDLSGFETRLTAVEGLAAGAPQAAITALEPRLAALEARPGAGPVAGAPDRAAIVAVGLTTLAAAIESGRPFVAELRAASAVVKDDDKLAALAGFADKGAPSATSLARDFEAIAPTLLEAINKEATGLAPDADVFERLLNSASQVVIIRKVGDESSDAAAPVTKTRDALLRGDLPAAIAAFDALPETVRELATAWRQNAKAAIDAADAVAKLRADALAALGG